MFKFVKKAIQGFRIQHMFALDIQYFYKVSLPPPAGHQVIEKFQQVESLKRQRWHERSNRKSKPKISQQNEDAIHLCLNGLLEIKNLDINAPMHRKFVRLKALGK